MKQSFYKERDYAFGQALLNLRTATGLTQTALAEFLGVSRKTIGRWEGGELYPNASHLKALLKLAVGQQAFTAGREEEEIRAFWPGAVSRPRAIPLLLLPPGSSPASASASSTRPAPNCCICVPCWLPITSPKNCSCKPQNTGLPLCSTPRLIALPSLSYLNPCWPFLSSRGTLPRTP